MGDVRLFSMKIVGGSALWHYSETGSGRPLVLLHGIGMSNAAWGPVIPYLRSERRVIAFDVPGFGMTPSLPRGTLPTILNLVEALYSSIQQVGIEVPVDIAGNSLGGCMALEAAKHGIARSVVAISPCGLWKEHPASHVKHVFRTLRFIATKFPYVLKTSMYVSLLREFGLAIPISVGSGRMPVADAMRAVEDLEMSTAFEATLENTCTPFSGSEIAVPVTVAFGERDWILTKVSQQRDRLPAHTKWIRKPRWGHVPMWVDPVGVSQIILGGAR
jgi:pimeloyl-ACP methyl ester carboxylesterase